MKVAVIGAGIVGASAAKALRDRNHQVTIFDRAPLLHERSAGTTMLYRVAHRSDALVQAAVEALLLFEDWQGEAGQELLHRHGTILTGHGSIVAQYAAAMANGGAAYEYREDSQNLHLPVKDVTLPSLIDPSGGVIRADRVTRFLTGQLHDNFKLAPVLSVEQSSSQVTVHTAGEDFQFDHAIIAAGQNTPQLLQSTGLEVSDRALHHFRFTYTLKNPQETYPSWISQLDGLITYQHMTAPGEWTIGLNMSTADMSLEHTRAEAEHTAKQALNRYVKDNLPQLHPKPIRVRYGTVNSDITDGYEIKRENLITTTYGDNLYKLAPHLGSELAKVALYEKNPKSLLLPPPD